MIKSVVEDEAKISDLAGQYEVGPSTIHKWVKQYHESQSEGASYLIPVSDVEKLKAAYEKKCVRWKKRMRF
ncbi:transposase [Solibacillus silvestris]|uniref:transposase n=1 Tax=Solibacillus silvestris TaxID=76853 RepID=UPI003F8095F1